MDPERAGLQIDQDTREWYSPDGELPEVMKSIGVEALHRRLGNVGLIASLYSQVALLLPADSVLLGSVLCDGSHAGDLISTERVGYLKQEISMLKNNCSPRSQEFMLLLSSLDALGNRNPIVFV